MSFLIAYNDRAKEGFTDLKTQMIMYTEKEVKELLKLQKKVCSDVASANWGSHVGKSVLKSPDVPLVKSTLASVSECKHNAMQPIGMTDKMRCLVCGHTWNFR